MTDPVKAIARRIGHRCRRFAVTEIRSERSTPWRSLLFDGGRHHIELSLRGDGVDAALTALEDEIAAAGFAISGHFIAELQIAEVTRSGCDALVMLDALTIEACEPEGA